MQGVVDAATFAAELRKVTARGGSRSTKERHERSSSHSKN